ncbi:hypothetical protein [Pseudoalteromonas luteoviolacea]|uniref:Uncharacterized protein n=1 Tax=Pseudoalteromonas luteoviolacea H33 TaxID=1365251 RepID=A0A162AI85_9GAMM|nr:hypothetical protein [Pseudoalteromonas luteoviolacea]KZN50347.1 hypothetical protein N476_02325 [Pseudoalteromonas luteoviolacea H33]KZN73149.1 hypothetical protein N477_02810 [Pseudoalteromonas luteoviolacea H33-S]MBQ4879718.1 hypothetical protein [Pseudoalteromonas luteoviolacea]MBQ4908780.1 hypothetical protein [Pseudoalteromonas luteoviolacea]
MKIKLSKKSLKSLALQDSAIDQKRTQFIAGGFEPPVIVLPDVTDTPRCRKITFNSQCC